MSIKTVFLKLRFGGVLHPRSVGTPLNSLKQTVNTHNLARNISITLQATPPALPAALSPRHTGLQGHETGKWPKFHIGAPG